MKISMLPFGIFVAIALLLSSGQANATTIFGANFDGLTKDYICSAMNASGDCGSANSPPGFTGFHQNTMCGNYGQYNSEVIREAGRSGKTTDRGFRINLEQRCFPTGENSLTVRLGADYKKFYLRWYQKMSLNKFDNFVKIFRMYNSAGSQILIPEFHNDNGATRFILGVSPFSGAAPFNKNYRLDTDYTPDTWVSYEILIDIPNQQWTFWVNGVNKGTLKCSEIDKSWSVRTIDVGGNQYGNYQTVAPHEDYIDYDDIIISDTYIGPDNAASQIPAPSGLRVVN